MNIIAALTMYRSNTTNSELMPYSFGTIISDKKRMIWSYVVNLMNFLALAAFLVHLKRMLT